MIIIVIFVRPYKEKFKNPHQIGSSSLRKEMLDES